MSDEHWHISLPKPRVLPAEPIIVPVPRGLGERAEQLQPGSVVGHKYFCKTCGVEVEAYDRLGVGDQHLREGALCGPVETFEVRISKRPLDELALERSAPRAPNNAG